MTTLVLGANGPLGLACVRSVLAAGAPVIAAVQAPHRLPPAIADLREEHAAGQLETFTWQAGRWPTLTGVSRVVVAELPIPPAQSDEPDDPTSLLRQLGPDQALHDVRALIPPTLAALQLVATIQPARVLVQASWLGSVEEKIRGGGYASAVGYAAHLMLVRAAALDLCRAGAAVVIGNAGRYKLDMAGPGFHAEVDEVARGLLAVLDGAVPGAEPEFRDWRGTLRRW